MAYSPNLFIFFLLSVILPALTPTINAQAFETDLELSLGYDDNVPQFSQPEDSAFALYHIKLARTFVSEALSFADGDIFLEGEYHDYFRVSDKYQLKAGASLGKTFANERLLPRIFCQGLLYRDNYQEEDDRDEIIIGGQADWIVNARLTLGIRQTLSRATYRNPVVICSNQTHSAQIMEDENANGIMMGHRYNHQSETSRYDDFYAAGLQGTLYLSPEINAVLSLERNRLDSSVDTESYGQNGVNLSFLWTPADAWEISAMTGWKRFDYDESFQDKERTDTRSLAGFGVSRFIKNIELFFHTEWMKNDSDSASESYRQTVTQCGVNFSF